MDLLELNQNLEQEIGKAIVGQKEILRQLLVCFFSGGHVLLEGVPGIAKTLLAKSLAAAVGGAFNRIQFTPDLMPSDILGTNILNTETRTFQFVKGPVFCDILLADEINRTPPKTQSALLEVMEERQITVEGIRHQFPRHFFVIATQNPVEYEGTYPLPEAQIDRFMMKITMGYPNAEEELALYHSYHQDPDYALNRQKSISHVMEIKTTTELQQGIANIRIENQVMEYLLGIIQRTRQNPQLLLGCSPRAGIALLLCSKTLAAFQGRDFVTPDDIKDNAGPVLRHRLILKPEAEVEGITADQIIQSILQGVKVPR
jgi:MoxR-like ATPase